jgi:hypothetical protein
MFIRKAAAYWTARSSRATTVLVVESGWYKNA